jgi:hypothetical protein
MDGSRALYAHAISVIRLSFVEIEADEIGKPPEWFKVINSIKRERDWRYVAKGEGVGDPSKIVLLVGWDDSKLPSESFQPSATEMGIKHTLCAQLQPLITQPPEIFTFWHSQGRSTPNLITTANRGRIPNGMRQFLMVCGPTDVVEPGVMAIEKSLIEFWNNREGGRFDEDVYHDDYDGAVVGVVEGMKPKDGEVTYGLVLTWRNREGRARFQNPGVADPTLSAWLQKLYGGRFWEDNIATRLREMKEQGAVVSSWDYWRAEIVRDKKGETMIAKAEDLW